MIDAVGHSAWGKFGGYLAEDITYTLFSKGGELVTYAATAGKAGTSVEQLRQEYAPITTDVLLNSGIVFLGHMIGKAPIFNHQVIWNSPTVANPLRYRIAEPILASDPRGLRYTLADSTGGAVMRLAGGKISFKGHVIELPTHGSLTLDEAHAWTEQAGTQLKHFLNDQVSLQDHAKQAIDISNAIVAAGRNAMKNANAAAQLNFTKPLFTYDQWLNRLGSEKGGNPLYKAIIEAAESQTKHPGEACFVAGTLVHTKDGLKPIEKIQVGDYVLSKPESGVGELSYQRVVKTFVHEDQPVLCVDVYKNTIEQEFNAIAEGKMLPSGNYFPLVTTANHPFFVKGKGWVSAENLAYGIDSVFMADGFYHYVSDVSKIVRTVDPSVGFLIYGRYCPIRFSEAESRAVYLTDNKAWTVYGLENRIENNEVEWWEDRDSDRLLSTVYNIEVENTHTYFVGEHGVWVHNKHPYLPGEADLLALEEMSHPGRS